MILVFKCTGCKKPNRLNKVADDRVELAKQTGNSNTFKCKSCGMEKTYNVNDVIAKHGPLYNIFLCGMVIATAVILWIMIPWLDDSSKKLVQKWLLLPVAVALPAIFFFNWLINENKRIRNFNKFKLRQ